LGRLLAWLSVFIIFPGCTTTPSPGQKFVMSVTQIPSTRQQLQHNPALSLALRRGVTRTDITSKRLMISGCYEKGKDGSIYKRQVLSLLPLGVTIKHGDVFKTTIEEAVAGKWQSLYFGRYVQLHHAIDADFFPYKYAVSNLAYRCSKGAGGNELFVQAYFEVETWLYDDAKAEEARNDQITDDELKQRRIVIGDCATGIESWVVWKVRLPLGLVANVGDYIEAIAGAYEAPRSIGPLSLAIRKVPRPPDADFIASKGRGDFMSTQGNPTPYKVSCEAQAHPYSSH